MPAATRLTRSTGDWVRDVRVRLVDVLVDVLVAPLLVPLLDVALRADVLVPADFLAALLFRAVGLFAAPRLAVFLPALLAVFVPVLRAAVFVLPVLLPVVPARVLGLRAPAVGEAALRAAVFRRGEALEVLADERDDDDERFVVPPVREPALRLELLGEDFLVAML